MRDSYIVAILVLIFQMGGYRIAAQIVDINSNSEGILIPRLSEAQKDSIDSPQEGMLIYQSDEDRGFYYNNGTEWVRISQLEDSNAGVKINDKKPSEFDLTYAGASMGSNAAHIFTNKLGYYTTFTNYDSIATTSILFSQEDCSGTMYLNSGLGGRGFVGKSLTGLLYVPKNANVIPQRRVRSFLYYSIGNGWRCSNSNTFHFLVFAILPNDPSITGIDLDPKGEYKITFGN